MRLTTIGILFTVMVLAVSAAAQTAPPPTTTVRKVVAAAKLPTVTNAPLHFKVQSVTLSPGDKSTVSGINSVLYQLSGSAEVSGVGETRTLSAGDGLLIAAGTTAELKAISGAPSVVLQFVLSPASDLDRPTTTDPAAVKELYRTTPPIPDRRAPMIST
jgi:quercetin dioxygenase-like cupin family protein